MQKHLLDNKRLAYGFEQHDFVDTKKLAAEMKTKIESDIETFLKSCLIQNHRVKF